MLTFIEIEKSIVLFAMCLIDFFNDKKYSFYFMIIDYLSKYFIYPNR